MGEAQDHGAAASGTADSKTTTWQDSHDNLQQQIANDYVEDSDNNEETPTTSQRNYSDESLELGQDSPVPGSDDLSEGCRTPASGSLADWALLASQSPTRRCPFCPFTRRPFRNAKALEQNIESAAHSEAFVFCPVALSGSGHWKLSTVRQFTTLGGLAQHIESGACGGSSASFWKIVQYIEMRFKDMGMPLRLVQSDGM